MTTRRRLDSELLRRGLVASREAAKEAVAGGRVLVAGAPASKPSRLVAPGEAVVLVGAGPRFVSRGGDKLAAALQSFAVEVAGRRAIDAGASTGGFTHCLLAHGVASVVALDVGRGQLHPSVASDARVSVMDRTNVRNVTLASVGSGPFEVVVADLSFISLRTVARVLAGELAAPGADVIVLVKPQFEVGRAEASRGKGVIRDPELWRRSIGAVGSALNEAGAAIMGMMTSPLRGAQGNVEFFLHARAHAAIPEPLAQPALDSALQTALEGLS